MSLNDRNGVNSNDMNMDDMNVRNKKNARKTYEKNVRTRVTVVSAVLCSGICGYVLFSVLFRRALVEFDVLHDKYLASPMFAQFYEMLYSFVALGLPFLLVCRFLKLFTFEDPEIKFGKPYSKTNAALLIVAGIGVCFFGNIVNSILMSYFGMMGVDFYSYHDAMDYSDAPVTIGEFVFSCVRSAVLPALMEEFALRGVVLGTLRKYGDGFAIGISAVLFGLMHGNFTQVPFAIIAGVALGFVYVITGSIWSSIILHFCNNFIVVLYSTAISLGIIPAAVVSSVLTYFLIAMGAIALCVYLLRNRNGLRLRRSPFTFVRGKTLAFMLSPTFIIGAFSLIRQMANDIIK